jgi:hypothetical protein
MVDIVDSSIYDTIYNVYMVLYSIRNINIIWHYINIVSCIV